ncbi:hypothetical protein GCM10010964_20060 [Caldovatus sediminis]|uniref:Glycosyltransferase RgtA/B/C/D-like domain-containing protein n=1 Tax=Caldovatus sediminis TaxID=2041189 RepID=A0A8J2ZAS3_9PROT|nr:glycosyltransferase family 39 protein [Caldovatus sediminis]GGG32122.1 hypothetical protein GCM10010964_20060 [Caldovatus sediminis]
MIRQHLDTADATLAPPAAAQAAARRIADRPPRGRGAGAAPRARSGLGLALALGPAVLLLVALLLRWPSFIPSVIDPDEGLYVLQAREWLRGGWPFVAVWDLHPPGAPALIAGALAAFGETLFAVRLLGALAVAATGLALHALVRAAGGPRLLGLGAGLLYVGSSVTLGGLATNTEILFAPFVAAAMALGVRAATRLARDGAPPSWAELAPAGLAIGVALTIKPVAAPEGCLAFALLVGPAWWRGVLPAGRALAMAGAYAALCAAPTAALALAYAAQGEFGTFLDAVILAPMRYVEEPIEAVRAARITLGAAVTLALPLALAAVALLPRPRRGARPAAGAPTLARIGVVWLAVATVAVVAPGRFFQHYFLIWLPPLSLLAALGARRLARLAPVGRGAAAFAGLVGAVALDAAAGATAPALLHGIGLREPDPPRRLAALIAADLPPGEPIYVVNYHPVTYFLARAGVPTRFAFPAHLAGRESAVTGLDADAELARVLASRPRLMVVDRGRWCELRPEAAAMVAAALGEAYALSATVPGERGSVELWRRR